MLSVIAIETTETAARFRPGQQVFVRDLRGVIAADCGDGLYFVRLPGYARPVKLPAVALVAAEEGA